MGILQRPVSQSPARGVISPQSRIVIVSETTKTTWHLLKDAPSPRYDEFLKSVSSKFFISSLDRDVEWAHCALARNSTAWPYEKRSPTPFFVYAR